MMQYFDHDDKDNNVMIQRRRCTRKSNINIEQRHIEDAYVRVYVGLYDVK
jgi:hypothetical protein